MRKSINKFFNKIADKCRKIGTVKAIIKENDELFEIDTALSLEELQADFEVISYKGKLVKGANATDENN